MGWWGAVCCVQASPVRLWAAAIRRHRTIISAFPLLGKQRGISQAVQTTVKASLPWTRTRTTHYAPQSAGAPPGTGRPSTGYRPFCSGSPWVSNPQPSPAHPGPFTKNNNLVYIYIIYVYIWWSHVGTNQWINQRSIITVFKGYDISDFPFIRQDHIAMSEEVSSPKKWKRELSEHEHKRPTN